MSKNMFPFVFTLAIATLILSTIATAQAYSFMDDARANLQAAIRESDRQIEEAETRSDAYFEEQLRIERENEAIKKAEEKTNKEAEETSEQARIEANNKERAERESKLTNEERADIAEDMELDARIRAGDMKALAKAQAKGELRLEAYFAALNAKFKKLAEDKEQAKRELIEKSQTTPRNY